MLYVSKSLETFTRRFSQLHKFSRGMFHISVDIQQNYPMIPETITRDTHNSKKNHKQCLISENVHMRYPKITETFTGVFHNFGDSNKGGDGGSISSKVFRRFFHITLSQRVFQQSGDIHIFTQTKTFTYGVSKFQRNSHVVYDKSRKAHKVCPIHPKTFTRGTS